MTRSITRELPGNIPFSAKKSLITAFQQTWLTCAVDCFAKVKHSMLALLMRCIDEKFGRYELLHARLKYGSFHLESFSNSSNAEHASRI
jgi:hypothetical protein